MFNIWILSDAAWSSSDIGICDTVTHLTDRWIRRDECGLHASSAGKEIIFVTQVQQVPTVSQFS